MGRWLVALGMMLVAACSGATADDGVTPTTASSSTAAPTTESAPTTTAAPTTTVDATTTTEATTTTTVAETTTTAPIDPDAPPDNTVDDPLEAMLAVWEFVNWVGYHPDRLGLIDNYFGPNCDCYENITKDTQVLIDNGWVYEDEGNQLVAVMELPPPGPAEIRARYRLVDWQGASIVVDGEGNEVRRTEGSDNQIEEMTFERGDDRRWRVLRWRVVTPLEGFQIRSASGETLTGWDAWKATADTLPATLRYMETGVPLK